MKVLVAGATSLVGQALAQRLVDGGHTVRTMARSSGDIRADVTQPHTLAAAVEGMDAVYSLVGASIQPTWLRPEQTFQSVDRDGNRALILACEQAGVQRFVYLSVFGPDTSDLPYIQCHRDVEHTLAHSALTYTCVRPTGFFSSLDLLRAFTHLAPAVDGGRAKTNPLHEDDLADVLASVCEDGPPCLPCGGPEVFTRRELQTLLAGTRRQVFVPGRALSVSRALLRPLNPRLADLVGFIQYILTHDCVAPTVGVRSLRTERS